MALSRAFSKYYFERLMALPQNRLFSEQTSVYQQGESTPTISAKQESKSKRPPNQYQVYVKEVYEKFQTQGEKSTTITKKIATEWKALSEEQRKPYAEKAEKLKKEFEQQQLSTHVENIVQTVKSPATAKQVKKLTGYQIFFKEKTQALKQQFPDKRAQEIRKELSAHWKALTEAEKQQYKYKALWNMADIEEQGQTQKNILQDSMQQVPLSVNTDQAVENLNLQNEKEKKVTKRKSKAATDEKDLTKQNLQSTEDDLQDEKQQKVTEKKVEATTKEKDFSLQNPQSIEYKNMAEKQNSQKEQGQKLSREKAVPSTRSFKQEKSHDVSLQNDEKLETQTNSVFVNNNVVGGQNEKEQVAQEKTEMQQNLSKKQQEEALEAITKGALDRFVEKNGNKKL